MIDKVAELGLSIVVPKDVLRRERRTERKGVLLGRQGLAGLKSLLFEAVAIGDERRRYMLVRGYAEAFSEAVFPTPKTEVLSRTSLAIINAQGDYEFGTEKILTSAIEKIRNPQP